MTETVPAAQPGFSAVVPTPHGVVLNAAIEAVTAQTFAVGGEVILATSKLTDAQVQIAHTGVRVIEVPGASILGLRAAGLDAARGQTIGLTEDHAIVHPRWVQSTLEAHARHPGAAVIGGAVANGSRSRLIDWANFLMTFGPFLPPITAAEHLRSPAIANMSLKRDALPAAPLRPGELEFELMPRFAIEGRIAFDEAPSVWHVQAHSCLGTIRLHYLNGRMTAGTASAGERWQERRSRLRIRRVAQLMRDGLVTVRTKALPRRGRASLPLLLLLCCAHVAGEWVGAVLGPGQSAQQLD